MKTEYLKIKMEDVRDIVRKRGYYYISADRLFDEGFIGPKLYIVTDNPNFAAENPALADMVIMTVAEFEPIAQAINEYVTNDDRERHRIDKAIELFEIIDNTDYIGEYLNEQNVKEAMNALNPVQKRRFIMRYYMNLSLREIGRIQGVSYKSVGESLEQAVEIFKREYSKYI